MAGPLSGYRILELTSTVSGPMAAMMLGDQGADVIKIEPPGFGDSVRYMGSSRNGIAGMFAVLNRNKRSLSLDLKSAPDMGIFLKLVETADVLLENYRPGIVQKLGIDYETLSKINPRLVYTSVSGYGQDGPYQNRKVYDPLIQATTGIADMQGIDAPRNMQSIVFDKVTALTTAQVITAALLTREKTGVGQYLPVSMLESALYYMWPDVMWSRTLLGDDIRHAGELADYFPIFEAKDGHISIILIRDEDLEILCVWRGSRLHEDERFATFPNRLLNAEAFKAAVDAMLADVTTKEICENLDGFNIPVARVNSLDDLHQDPQILHAQSLVDTKHPDGGAMRMARPPFNFAGQDEFPKRHAPAIGHHTAEILRDLGIHADEIERLERRDAENRDRLEQALAAIATPQDSGSQS